MSNYYKKLYSQIKDTSEYQEFLEEQRKIFNAHVQVKLIDGELTRREVVSMLTEVVFGLIEGKELDDIMKGSPNLDNALFRSFTMACTDYLTEEIKK